MALYPGAGKVRQDALKEVGSVDSAFQRAGESRCKIVGILGEGTGGVALKMTTVNKPSPNLQVARNFILKRAYNSQQEESLRREIDFVRRFRGDMHIAQFFSLEGGPVHGDLDQSEHPFVNSLVLIDFGASRIDEDKSKVGQAAKMNISKMGEVMLNLIGGMVRKVASGSSNMTITVDGEEETLRSWARDLDGLNPAYGADADTVAGHKDRMDNLDPDIRRLVIRCLATSMNNRPELEDLVEEVEQNVSNKTAAYYTKYKYGSNETDSAVERIMKELLHDAKTS
ncbi:hypothetical protein Hte_002069 [Hypoxylon texense]